MFYFNEIIENTDLKTIQVIKATYLNNSVVIDLTLVPQGQHLLSIIQTLAPRILEETPNGFRRTVLLKNLNCIISNLYTNWRNSELKYTVYTRMRSAYKSDRYNPVCISYSIVKVIDWLSTNGFVEGTLGCYDRANPKNGKSYRSRMRATSQLIDLFSQLPSDIQMVGQDRNSESVILKTKDADGRNLYVDYVETAATDTMRRQLSIYNLFIDKIDVRLGDGIFGMEETDFNYKSVRRVFNDTWDSGGRLYGGWWQDVPGPVRKHTLIDGCKTIEVDFSAIHLVILHAMKGIEYNIRVEGDPYLLDAFPTDKNMRSLIKQSFNMCINTKSRESAMPTISKSMRKEPHKYAQFNRKGITRDLVDGLMEKHSTIKDLFFKELWRKCQYIDSCIAMEIVNRMTRNGLPVLPIHDSFIAKESDALELRDIMFHSFKDVMLELIGIEITTPPHTKVKGDIGQDIWEDICYKYFRYH